MSRRPWLALSLSLVVTPFTRPAAAAETLASLTLGVGGGQDGRTETVSFPVNYFLNPVRTDNPTLFENFSFTPADVGNTVTLRRGDDPDFDVFTSLLTDGVNQRINFWFLPAPAVNQSGVLYSEPQMIWGNDNDPRVDLQGQAIGAYTLRLDKLTISNTPTRSNFDSRITFSVLAVPEPATAMTMSLLAAVLLMRRRPGTRVADGARIRLSPPRALG